MRLVPPVLVVLPWLLVGCDPIYQSGCTLEARPPVVVTFVDASGARIVPDSVSWSDDDGTEHACEPWLSYGFACEIDVAGHYTVKAWDDGDLLVEEPLALDATEDGCYLENYEAHFVL